MYVSKVVRSARMIVTPSHLTSVVGAAVLSLPLFAVTSIALVSQPVAAQNVCSSPSSDPDGDGYGWENNQSCVVGSGSSSSNTSNSNAASSFPGVPSCSSSSADPDGDGFGWENNQSCVVRGGSSSSVNNSSTDTAAQAALAAFPSCTSTSDTDGDGYGWENNRTCVFNGNSSQSSAPAAQASSSGSSDTSGGFPVCRTAASDTSGDGYGFENGVSCIVTSASGAASAATSVATPGNAPPPVAAATAGFQNGNPICLTDASDAGNNGFGFENDRTCVVVPGATATRSNPLLNQRSCIPWLEIGYGNYRLQNNVWNFGAVFSDNWSQCIELTGGPGNYVAKWDYNWLNRNEGGEFDVKSYPQVYIGRKTQYNLSGSVAETGMPVRVDSMPQFRVDYDYSETGVVERNVALESFIHNSCNAEEHNKQFEMMIWVGVPTIRTPGTPVTTATIDGREWIVYINPALGWSYVAFVAAQPHTSGSLNWNDFVYWSRDVGPSFGVPYMNPNGCMGAIEIGTETFWGTGTFTLNRFNVSHR